MLDNWGDFFALHDCLLSSFCSQVEGWICKRKNGNNAWIPWMVSWWCILITFYQHHHCVPWLWSCGPDFRLRKKINKKNTAFIPFIAIYKLEKPKVHVSTRHYGGLEVDSCLWGPCVFVPIVGCLPFSFWFFEEIWIIRVCMCEALGEVYSLELRPPVFRTSF